MVGIIWGLKILFLYSILWQIYVAWQGIEASLKTVYKSGNNKSRL